MQFLVEVTRKTMQTRVDLLKLIINHINEKFSVKTKLTFLPKSMVVSPSSSTLVYCPVGSEEVFLVNLNSIQDYHSRNSQVDVHDLAMKTVRVIQLECRAFEPLEMRFNENETALALCGKYCVCVLLLATKSLLKSTNLDKKAFVKMQCR